MKNEDGKMNKELITTKDVLTKAGVTITYTDSSYNPHYHLILQALLDDGMSDKLYLPYSLWLNEEAEIDTDALDFYTLIIIKRLKTIDMLEHFEASALLGCVLYSFNSPAMAVIYAITLLEIRELKGSKVSFKDVHEYFSEGFYSKETVYKIIDKVHKPKLSTFSEIY